MPCQLDSPQKANRWTPAVAKTEPGSKRFGGRGRDRTGDPLLANIGRTQNERLTRHCYPESREAISDCTSIGKDASLYPQ